MKTIFRFLSLAVLGAGFTIAGGTAIFAQDAASSPCDNTEARTALEQKVRDNYAANPPRVAVAAGEEYIKTYGSCEAEDIKAFITYLNGYLPPAKAKIKAVDDAAADKLMFDKFDASVNATNWDDMYAAGKQIIAKYPDNLNVILVMGSPALDEVAKNPSNNKYNDDTIKYAKLAIQKIQEGKTSKNGGWGVLKISYGNKENALAWMNWTIGYVMYNGQKNKKDALPYIYESTKHTWTEKLPQVYGIIGDYYYDQAKTIGDDIRAKVIAAGNKDTDETKTLVAQQKAYAERGIDAYARAQQLASDAKYKAGLAASIEALYKVRFQKIDGLSAFVTDTLKKSFPDPSTVPTPIVEADPDPVPATTTGNGTGTGPSTPPGVKPPMVPAATDTRPMTPSTTNGTKPAPVSPGATKKPVSVNSTSAPSATATAIAKTTVKKPVAKKKGTR